MKKILRLLLASTIISITIVACSKGGVTDEPEIVPPPADKCEAKPAKFSADVNPIIQTNCAIGSGCHGEGSFNGPGSLTSFEQIKNAASSIKSAVVSKRMPLGRSLTAAQIETISCWVDNNSPND